MKYCAIGLVALAVVNSALGELPAPLQEPLRRFQTEQVFYKQLEVAKDIVALRDKRVLPALEGWLNHEDRHIRGNVAFIFAGLKDKRGLATIYEILDDHSDRPLGQGIPGVAGNINNDRWWLKSQIEADRYYAVHLLGELGDPAAIPVLAQLRDDPEVGYKVPWAINEIRAAHLRKAIR
jgi:HEAT repeat protein